MTIIAIKPNAGVEEELLNKLETTHARCSSMSGVGKGGKIVDKFSFPLFLSIIDCIFICCLPLPASQATKMGMGKMHRMTSFHGSLTLVHVNIAPLIMTFVHGPSSNCGMTLDLVPTLERALEPIRAQVIFIYARLLVRQ